MTTRAAVLCAVAATTTVVVAFCAWFLRPLSEVDQLKTFPRAWAKYVVEEDWRAAEKHLADDFAWRGPPAMERGAALDLLKSLVAQKRFFPYVADVEAVPAEGGPDRWNVIIHGVLVEGDPSKLRRPMSRAFRLEALIVSRDGRFVVLEARL